MDKEMYFSLYSEGKKLREEVEKDFGINFEWTKDVIMDIFEQALSEDDYLVLLSLLLNYDEMFLNPDEEDKKYCVRTAYTEIHRLNSFKNLNEDLFF